MAGILVGRFTSPDFVTAVVGGKIEKIASPPPQPPLDAGLPARSQYSEGPATGHLDTGFSWFPCA